MLSTMWPACFTTECVEAIVAVVQAEIGEREGDSDRRMGRELLRITRESHETLTQYVLRRVSANWAR